MQTHNFRNSIHDQTMVSGNAIADGAPVSVSDARDYLQDHFGVPIALKKKGHSGVKCPHCGKEHFHQDSGYQDTQCSEEDRRGRSIVVGERSFVPNYGCTVVEYEEGKESNRVIAPDCLLK